jgi:hypothetical protein
MKAEDVPPKKKRERKAKLKEITYVDPSSYAVSSVTGDSKPKSASKLPAIIVYYNQFVKQSKDVETDQLTKMLH